MDVCVEKEVHVVEYHPGLGFGVSRMCTATFGWEGVENEFESLAAAESYVVGLLEKKPIQPPQTTSGLAPDRGAA